MAPKPLINIVDTHWSPNLAYIIGLIASDGYLDTNTYRVGLVSKDRELINNFQKILSLKNKVTRRARGGEKSKKYLYLEFKSKNFYQFLNYIGIKPRKSKTIRSVIVPNKFFIDFFRGLFDGDGTFWSYWDTRWPNSFVFHLGISSASFPFMLWLKNKLTFLYGVKGYIARGKGAYTIRYVKRDSKILFERMYYKSNLLYLSRKYLKIKTALDFDQRIKQIVSTPR